jgi:outer membrane protein OmpA-like peptidoglycan-associated protein
MPNLEAALALRFDSEKRTVDNNVPKLSPQTPGFGAFGHVACPGGPGPTCTDYINPFYNLPANAGATSIPNRSDTFSQVEPKLSLDWKFIPDWAAFASWGVGFRSGGFNSSGSAATVAEYFGAFKYVDPSGAVTNIAAISNVNDEYKKEVSKAAEIGFKGEMLNRSLFLSADYYYTKVDDMQIFNFFAGPFGLLRVVTNVDRAKLDGFEGSVRWKATSALTLFAGAASVDSRIDAYSGRPYTVGNKVPYAPNYTADAGIDLNIPVAPSTALIARLDANSVGKTWFSPVQNNSVQTLFGAPGDYSKTYRDPYTLMNARLGIAKDNWDVTAWSRNLTNKNYLAEVIPAPEFGGSFIHQGVGRSFGVEFSYRFAGERAAAPPPPVVRPVAVEPPAAPPPPAQPVAPPPPAPQVPVAELVLKGVNFETDSARLKSGSTAILDEVASTIKRSGSRKVDIRGYTDSAGKPGHNLKLSERRANAVKEYLEAHGVPPGVLTAQGFGESNPLAPNDTASGRAQNRRVTVQYSAVAK